MVRPLISKIRCNNPNKKSSPMRNHNLLVYIGSREGVDISNPELDKLVQEDALQGVISISDAELDSMQPTEKNGLFGNIETEDIHKLANHITGLTRDGKNIYNGIISLHEEDALRLGYDTKEAWLNSMYAVLPDIAKEFHIPIDKLAWVGALHMEAGHPHCHYMFWRTDEKVRSPFIHSSVQDRCRMNISKVFLEADREAAAINKTLARDSSIAMTKEELNKLSDLMNPSASIPGRVTKEDLEQLSDKMKILITALPPTGRIAYKLLPVETKLLTDDIVRDLCDRPDIKKELEKYYESVDQLSDSYSANQQKKDINKVHAKDDINKRLANVVLATAKTIRSEERRIQFEEQKKESQEKYAEQCRSSLCFSLVRNSLNVINDSTRQNNAVDPFKTLSKPTHKKKKRRKTQHQER